MKISKTFRLSEEAVAVLDKQRNATEYLEHLILRGEPELTEERVIQLIKMYSGSENFASGASPKQSEALDDFHNGLSVAQDILVKEHESTAGGPKEWVSAGKDVMSNMTPACCLNKTVQCKHWDWDGLTQTYTNRNTGEVIEVGVE